MSVERRKLRASARKRPSLDGHIQRACVCVVAPRLGFDLGGGVLATAWGSGESDQKGHVRDMSVERRKLLFDLDVDALSRALVRRLDDGLQVFLRDIG